jgi:hypothetical protein
MDCAIASSCNGYMSAAKMHVDEVRCDALLVRRLLAAQFPRWADLNIESIQSSGTDNAQFRLGNDMVVRLPRIQSAAGQVAKEQHWLPILAPFLTLPIQCRWRKGCLAKATLALVRLPLAGRRAGNTRCWPK